MGFDSGTSERVRRVAAELAVAHTGDRATRAAFLERAIEAVDRLAQTVDDSGLRAALDADTDAALLSALGLVKNGTSAEPGAASDPLAAAKARGEQAKREIIAEQGDLLDATQVAARLGASVDHIEKCRLQGLLVALPIDVATWKFPAWQFTDHAVLPGLEDVLRALPVLDPWSRVMFLTYGDPYLDGDSPLTQIQRGDVDRVRRLAAAYEELVAT